MTSKGRKPPAKKDVERIESIPDDVVLAPQAEAPRGLAAMERNRQGAPGKVREMSWMEFDRLVQGLAREVRKRFKPDAVVGVAHGGVFVGGALASALSVEFYPVRITRRSRDKAAQEKKPKLTGDMPKELKGQRVLVVDDVAASGDTLELACERLEKVGVKALGTVCLVCREDGFQPDFFSLTAEEFIVFPWDYDLVDDERFSPPKRSR